MEINTEINRVFGQEMAKIFAGSINEEDITKTAKDVWDKYTNCKYVYTYGNREYHEYESQADFFIKREFANILKNEVEKITSTDEFKTQMKNMAKDIVNEIVSETRRKMIDEVSNRMVAFSTGHQGFGMKDMISQVVYDMIQR